MMRTFANILIVILFIPIFLAGVLTATAKFKLLDSWFWLDTFEKHNVYPTLTQAVNKSIEERAVREGADKNAAKIITNIITTDNVENFLKRNITQFLDFANGKVESYVVYLPIKQFPKGLLPDNIAGLPEQIPVNDLLTKFNIQGVNSAQVDSLRLLGRSSSQLLIIETGAALFLLILFYLIAAPGKSYSGPGAALLISGLLILGVSILIDVIRVSMLSDWGVSKEPSQIILSTFAPFVLENILRFWTIIGGTSLVLGICLFIVKKPASLK